MAMSCTFIHDFAEVIEPNGSSACLATIDQHEPQSQPHGASSSVSTSTPFYLERIAAGFPSPCDDYLTDPLNLHDYLVSQPAATFLVRAIGDSMQDQGIMDGDILVVDRSRKAVAGNIVVADINSEFTVKILEASTPRPRLLPANPAYPPITLNEADELRIWGVVTGVARRLG
ncbi:LexA family protein [Pokkaliibacter sp. CJK22405]|uniref:LexA family protein n=1 Tax=Pokkaliibacter sp. CJK22405 TaxID=3384615 RepID=UPI0039848D61